MTGGRARPAASGGNRVERETVILVFGVACGVLVGFCLGAYGVWAWMRWNRLLRDEDEWRRARSRGRTARRRAKIP